MWCVHFAGQAQKHKAVVVEIATSGSSYKFLGVIYDKIARATWADHSAKLGERWRRSAAVGSLSESILRKAKTQHDAIFGQRAPLPDPPRAAPALPVANKREQQPSIKGQKRPRNETHAPAEAPPQEGNFKFSECASYAFFSLFVCISPLLSMLSLP